MLKSGNRTPTPRSIALVRIATGILLGIHGWHRLLSGGYAGFGEYLQGRGIPLPAAVALAITLFEIVGSLLLVSRRLVIPVALGHTLILAVGIVMVHGPEGWFVVGAGRNGAEFSLLLIACLAAIVGAEFESIERGRAGGSA